MTASRVADLFRARKSGWGVLGLIPMGAEALGPRPCPGRPPARSRRSPTTKPINSTCMSTGLPCTPASPTCTFAHSVHTSASSSRTPANSTCMYANLVCGCANSICTPTNQRCTSAHQPCTLANSTCASANSIRMPASPRACPERLPLSVAKGSRRPEGAPAPKY